MENKSPVALACTAAGALLLLGTFLPWVKVSGFGSGGNAFDATIGFLMPVAGAFFLYAGIMMMQGKEIPEQARKPVYAYVATGVCLLIVVVNFFDSAFSVAGISRGIGLWLAMLGTVAAVIASVMIKNAMASGSGPMGPGSSSGGPTPPSSPF